MASSLYLTFILSKDLHNQSVFPFHSLSHHLYLSYHPVSPLLPSPKQSPYVQTNCSRRQSKCDLSLNFMNTVHHYTGESPVKGTICYATILKGTLKPWLAGTSSLWLTPWKHDSRSSQILSLYQSHDKEDDAYKKESNAFTWFITVNFLQILTGAVRWSINISNYQYIQC